MNTSHFESDDRPLDRATAALLTRLGTMPVNTTRLDRMIQAAIPRPVAIRPVLWMGPQRFAIAACLMAAIGLAALLIGTSGGPVMASTAEMAQFHDDLVSGRVPSTHVDSMQAANLALAAQWARSPQVPNIPSAHVMACCMRSLKNKKMDCVLLEGDGQPVTMVVANGSDMQMPASTVVARGGVEYHIDSTGALNMVMTQRHGRLVCLIAKLPVDRLMDLASGLEF
jgi:hypothetical protein